MSDHIIEAQLSSSYPMIFTVAVTALDYIDHHLAVATFVVGLPLMIIKTLVELKKLRKK